MPKTLLGVNLEVCLGADAGMVTDKLFNPKFQGPEDGKTGLAQGWNKSGSYNLYGVDYRLVEGESMSGTTSQMIHSYGKRNMYGILQLIKPIKGGEDLEVELWARAQHRPIKITVGVRPVAANKGEPAQADILVDRTYWKRYTAILKVKEDEEEPLFFCYVGDGIIYIDQIHLRPKGTHLEEGVQKIISDMKIPVMRFPGGCATTNYYWRYGIGPAHKRPTHPDQVFKAPVYSYEFGTDEYLAMCVANDIIPQITVNISNETPEDAAEWAKYVRNWFIKKRIKPPFMYWQIGNEHYGFWEHGNMTGEMYADVLKEFVPGIKKAYPNSKIIALGVKTGGGMYGGEEYAWRKRVVKKAAKYFDLLAIQHYTPGKRIEDKEKQMLSLLKGVKNITKSLQETIKDSRMAGKNKTVAITEWNHWMDAGHCDNKDFLEFYDVQHCLYVSAVFHEFVKLAPKLELANFYNLVNPMGIILNHGRGVIATSLVEVFKLYRPAFPGRVVSLKNNSKILTGDLRQMDSLCLKNEQGTWLFLINRSTKEEATIELSGFPAVKERVCLSGINLESEMKKSELWISSSGKVGLPPFTMARVKF